MNKLIFSCVLLIASGYLIAMEGGCPDSKGDPKSVRPYCNSLNKQYKPSNPINVPQTNLSLTLPLSLSLYKQDGPYGSSPRFSPRSPSSVSPTKILEIAAALSQSSSTPSSSRNSPYSKEKSFLEQR
jgi:hypothetical protein